MIYSNNFQILIQYYQVGTLSRGDASDLLFHANGPGGNQSGRLYRLCKRDTKFYQILYFLM